jgi:uncharacterized LabA/DUF88 family protein
MNDIPNKVVRRTVTTNPPSRAGFNSPENTETLVRANRQTWETRYNAIVSETGYNTGRQIIKATPIEQWLELIKDGPTHWFIESKFLYHSLVDHGLFLDFTKLHSSFIAQINYFAVSPMAEGGENRQMYKLLALLQNEGYHVVSKEVPQKLDTDALKTMPLDHVIRLIEHRASLNSVMPEMLVRLLELAWDADIRPEMNHAVIFSQNYQLLPAIAQLKRMDIKTTVVITSNRTMSNFFMRQFDYIVDMNELLSACHALSERIVYNHS